MTVSVQLRRRNNLLNSMRRLSDNAGEKSQLQPIAAGLEAALKRLEMVVQLMRQSCVST